MHPPRVSNVMEVNLEGRSIEAYFSRVLVQKLRASGRYRDVEAVPFGDLPPGIILVEATLETIVPSWGRRAGLARAEARVKASIRVSATNAPGTLLEFSAQRKSSGGLLGIGGLLTGGEETMLKNLLEWVADDVVSTIKDARTGER
jgi:hypothetical protein